MCVQRYSEVTCAFGLKKFLTSFSGILGRKSTARLKVNQNTRSPPLNESLKFRKRMGFSVLGSLITVPLNSTLAVNNLGLRLVCFVKCVIK